MQTRRPRTPRASTADAATVLGVETRSREGGTQSVLDLLQAALQRRLTDVGRIGEGGMGSVSLVLDRALERHTVIKRVHEDLASDPVTLRMFVREAQITGQLEHPSIVPVHELGLEAGALPFFTMKLVEGQTLDEIIRELPPGPIEHGRLLDLVDAVIKVADALAFAHSRGVVHCDLKPSNVMLGDFGQVYLMDWGIARRIGDEDDAPTAERPAGAQETTGVERSTPPGGSPVPSTGNNVRELSSRALVGTPTHMSPEQAMGALERLDERSDVFALGGLLYHLVTRSPPFVADNVWASIARAQAAAFTPVAEAAPHTPRGLCLIIEKAMMLAPEDRYESMSAMREELVAFVRGDGVFPLKEVKAGELVVREGDTADAAYIIETGRLEAFRGEGEEHKALRVMGPGEVFGEMAILAPGPRTASVRALEDAQLRVITAEALSRELDSLKPWMGAFVRTLATRFREREK